MSVQPSRQMVWSTLAWVTAGLMAPGVQVGSGSTSRPLPRAWQEPAPVRPAAGAEVGGAEVTGGTVLTGVVGRVVVAGARAGLTDAGADGAVVTGG